MRRRVLGPFKHQNSVRAEFCRQVRGSAIGQAFHGDAHAVRGDVDAELLGDRQRTRIFIEAAGAGADVSFLERPINNVRVCVSNAAFGLNRRYDIFIGDRLLSSREASQELFYSMSGRYFIQAFGKRFSDALKAGLGTVTPPC